MLHRCSAIGILADFKFFKGILLFPVAFLLSKLGIISSIYFLVHEDIRNESTQRLVNNDEKF